MWTQRTLVLYNIVHDINFPLGPEKNLRERKKTACNVASSKLISVSKPASLSAILRASHTKLARQH